MRSIPRPNRNSCPSYRTNRHYPSPHSICIAAGIRAVIVAITLGGSLVVSIIQILRHPGLAADFHRLVNLPIAGVRHFTIGRLKRATRHFQFAFGVEQVPLSIATAVISPIRSRISKQALATYRARGQFADSLDRVNDCAEIFPAVIFANVNFISVPNERSVLFALHRAIRQVVEGFHVECKVHSGDVFRRRRAIIATSGECEKHHDGKQKELLRRVSFLKAEHSNNVHRSVPLRMFPSATHKTNFHSTPNLRSYLSST